MKTISRSNNSALSFLPYMPFDPAWIEQSQAIVHADPRVGIAALRLLFAAWRGNPAGSIPSSHAYIASVTALPQEFVTEHYALLTEGFSLSDDGRLHHTALTKICEKMAFHYGREIEAYALATAMSVQDPTAFGIMNMEAGAKKGPRGKTLIPKDFGFDTCVDDLRGWCAKNMYPSDADQAYIMEKFIDYATGRGDKQKDWPATFRVYAANEIQHFRRFPPTKQIGVSGTLFHPEASDAKAAASPFANLVRRMPTKGDRTISHNHALLDNAANRTRGAGGLAT